MQPTSPYSAAAAPLECKVVRQRGTGAQREVGTGGRAKVHEAPEAGSNQRGSGRLQSIPSLLPVQKPATIGVTTQPPGSKKFIEFSCQVLAAGCARI